MSSSGEPAGVAPADIFKRAEAISEDGRFVAFLSRASNLVPGDTNELIDIFVRDRLSGTTKRVSISSSGEQAMLGSNAFPNGSFGSRHPSVSGDGRFIAFESDAANLVTTDINISRADIFVHDQETGTTELVSFLPNGEQRPSWGSFSPYISADGRFVTYASGSEIFVYDRLTSKTERIIKFTNGSTPSLSADGRFMVFRSNADDLVAIPDNGRDQAYVYDRQTNEIEIISVSMNGEAANATVFYQHISADGRFVTYTTEASNLVSNDTNFNPAFSSPDDPWGGTDVFVYDRLMKVTERVSVSSTGEEGNSSKAYSSKSRISADGRYVVFDNQSTNLAPGVTRSTYHVYVRDRQTKMTKLASRSDIGTSFFAEDPAISPDGSFIVFQAKDATDSFPGTLNYVTYSIGVDNPFFNTNGNLLTVEKLINNETRKTQDSAARLSTGTLYRQSYKVTNDSPNRIYQVRVFENGNIVCNFYTLNPGQTRQRCDTFNTVLDGEQRIRVTVAAKASGSGEVLSGSTDAYYTGLNAGGELTVSHRINNTNADTADLAPTLGTQQGSILFKVENTGDIELYQVKTYHDPVSPVNSGWDLQCVFGPMKPGQVRYCKKDIPLTEPGLNQSMGRVQGRNAIKSATDVVNASNPTYFIVP